VYLKAKDHFEDTGTDGGVLTIREEELVWIHKGTIGERRHTIKRGGEGHA